MATPNIVPRANGEGSLGTTAKGWGGLYITDTTTSSANTGGALQLAANDGAVMGDSHRLGVIEFKGAEDASGTLTTGARIEALTEAAWTNAENGGALYFYTTDDNASEGLALKIDSNQKASFTGQMEILSTTTQQKWFYDADSFASLTVANASVTTLATGETGNLVLDSAGNVEINADGGTISFKDASATLASLTSAGLSVERDYVKVTGFIDDTTTGASGAGSYLSHIISKGADSHEWGTVIMGSDEVIDNNGSFAKSSEHYCHRAGSVTGWGGVMAFTAGQTMVYECWKGTPVNDSQVGDGGGAVITLVLLATITDVGTAVAEINTMTDATLTGTAFAKGDLLFVTVRNSTGSTTTAGTFNTTIEITYS